MLNLIKLLEVAESIIVLTISDRHTTCLRKSRVALCEYLA